MAILRKCDRCERWFHFNRYFMPEYIVVDRNDDEYHRRACLCPACLSNLDRFMNEVDTTSDNTNSNDYTL